MVEKTTFKDKNYSQRCLWTNFPFLQRYKIITLFRGSADLKKFGWLPGQSTSQAAFYSTFLFRTCEKFNQRSFWSTRDLKGVRGSQIFKRCSLLKF